MDGKAHGDKPRLVAFESRLLGGKRNQSWEPWPLKTVDQLPELPPGQEYTTDENGFVTGIQCTAAERERLIAVERRRSEGLAAQKARELPIYPLRDGYKGEAPPEVVAAVRNVLTDWDGLNWVAVRHCIELTRRENESKDLDDWTLDDVRQRFAIGQKSITIELGGTARTTDATITPTITPGTVAITAAPTNAETTRRRRTAKIGRNKAKISKDEKRISNAWSTGKYKTHNDLDEALGVEWGTVEKTLDRLRARERRERQTTKRTK